MVDILMPFLHREKAADIQRCCDEAQKLADRCDAEGNLLFRAFFLTQKDSAQLHKEPIAKFGRYPTRNAALGRQNTAQEQEYLKACPNFDE